MSQTLDYSEFRKAFERIEGVKEKLPAIKEAFADRLGKQMLSEVQGRIGGSGTVQDWQEAYQGSHHGYAAVRAKAETYVTTKAGRKYAVGHITNAIENGHRIREPSGRWKYYKPRIKTARRVPGKGFYKQSQAAINAMAESAAKEIAEAIAKEIENA